MNKLLFKMVFGLLVIYASNSAASTEAEMNDACYNWRTSVGAGNHYMSSTATDEVDFYSVPLGGLLGRSDLGVLLECNGPHFPSGSYNTFLFHIKVLKPKANKICDTNLDGVGFRIINRDTASVLPCGSISLFKSVAGITSGNSYYDITTRDVIQLIKTKNVSSLKNGEYTVDLASLMEIYSSWQGQTSPTLWGRLNERKPFKVNMVNCIFAATSQVVNFGTVSVSNVAKGEAVKPFDISFNQCAANTAAGFNRSATLRFISSNILPDGTLNNDAASDHARGVAIEISKGNGTPIDLNQEYALSTGDYVISGNVVTHKFNAKLLQTGEIKVGKIHAVLVAEFSSP